MTRVFTGRVSYRGPDRLDVTRKSAGPEGVAFAPSWTFLGPMLKLEPAARAYAWPKYAADYTAEMRASYKLNRSAWDALVSRSRVVLVCYCVIPERCHRTLLARNVLSKLGATYRGEL